ncbi:MAG: PEP-CTERM sorting domain-containing protein [Okeania sp. SIO2F4]|uniref:PEP-CTERM sorting domain-containing protein n=1 Tax=Okeania sp. SIO2F4 TaxID=2607790 RepID=UPI00142B3304|nr:PEP-CTERM sorting domain-containing protein [Okeania sp. SIO2F4]NES03417.1 PEP-CTERM sorting domain-containing protein [Okeania sp. SIO2F4]
MKLITADQPAFSLNKYLAATFGILCGSSFWGLMQNPAGAASFTDINDFNSFVSSPTVVSFTETPRVSKVRGATFSDVQAGTFNANDSFQQVYANLGVVFAEGSLELGVPLANDNIPGTQPGGTDTVLVGDFGFSTPALGAFFVDPQTANGFVSPSQAFAVGGEVITPGNVTFSVFDIDGNLIESVTRNGSGFLGITSSTAIAAATLEYDIAAQSGLDTFIFQNNEDVVASTPEPSLMLGFITLGGVLLGSKRKTKS